MVCLDSRPAHMSESVDLSQRTFVRRRIAVSRRKCWRCDTHWCFQWWKFGSVSCTPLSGTEWEWSYLPRRSRGRTVTESKSRLRASCVKLVVFGIRRLIKGWWSSYYHSIRRAFGERRKQGGCANSKILPKALKRASPQRVTRVIWVTWMGLVLSLSAYGHYARQQFSSWIVHCSPNIFRIFAWLLSYVYYHRQDSIGPRHFDPR